ncbi:carbohydrate esterase family 5 protein, partial [Sphaerobolus stellatus SS14]
GNDIMDGECASVVLIYAKGTFEKGLLGTVGIALANAMAVQLNFSLAIQGVPYNATVYTYFVEGGSNKGAEDMAMLINDAAIQCAQARIVLGGYSQGALVLRKALNLISHNVYRKFAAIVLFGAPMKTMAFPEELRSRILSICHVDDPLCHGIPIPVLGHLTYWRDVGMAALWVFYRL